MEPAASTDVEAKARPSVAHPPVHEVEADASHREQPGRVPAGARARPLLPNAVASLQAGFGNRAVARTIQRYGMDNAPDPHKTRVATGEILPPDYADKSDEEKLAWIGQYAATTSPFWLTQAWEKLSDPMAGARAKPELFASSVKRARSIGDLEPFKVIRDKFAGDVEDRAHGILEANRRTVHAELEKVGGEDGGKAPTAEQDYAVQEVQKASEEMSQVRMLKEKLLDTVIGHKKVTTNAYSGAERDVMVKFSPDGPPPLLEPIPSGKTWAEANTHWRKMLATEAALIRKSPSAAFFLRADQTEDPKRLKDMEIKDARAQISKALVDLQTKIDEAKPKVGNDLKFSDFVPLHQQLLSGQAAASNTPWANPVEKSLAQASIADADFGHLLTSLAVGTASAAAFILAEFATGGLATFLFVAGAAASAGTAAVAWDHALDLSKAADATVDPDLALVSGEQVSSAMVEAVIATVFAFVDAGGAIPGIKNAMQAKSLLKAGEAGSALAAKTALKDLAASADAAPKLAKALAEIGPHEVRTATGKSFKELATIAGETTPEGQLLLKLAERDAGQLSKSVEELGGKLASLKDVPKDQLEQVLAEGVAAFGNVGMIRKAGGWKALMGSGAGSTTVGHNLEAWRSGIVEEMKGFISKESKEASQLVRTGTPKASSDVDVQILGGEAASLQQKAEAWLGARLGTSEKESKLLLDAEIFVDSTRAHLQDVVEGLDASVRAQITAEASSVEKSFIYGARLNEAEGEAAKEAIRAEAKAINVTPMENFKALSSSQQTTLAKEIDGLVVKLGKTTDPAEKAALIKKIGNSQAMINASHPDAYVGGGVRLWVTDRPIDAKTFAEAGITLKTGLGDSQRVVAALSEGRWIQRAVSQLEAAKDVESAAVALRNIGKHGERVTSVLKAGHPPSADALSSVGTNLLNYKTLYDEGLLTAQVAEKLPALRAEASSYLATLQAESSVAIRALEADAKALQVPAEELARFQDWVQTQLLIEKISGSITGSINAFIREVETALQISLGGGNASTPTSAGPPGSSVSTPANSGANTPTPSATPTTK